MGVRCRSGSARRHAASKSIRLRGPQAGDLSAYDLILPLLAWGYYDRFAEWLALLDRFERERLPVVNPPALLRWNSDKAYLAELAGKGVSTVPTLAVDRLRR